MMLCRCAQVGQLNGGKRDTMPPKLVSAIPQNAAVNVSGKEIELTFDEFIQVKDVSNQVIITPQTKELPDIQARGKKVVIKFKEELKNNTTYHLFFGNAISDMHEGNLLGNFEYVFSTGTFIDSLVISGKVTNAFNTVPEKVATVALFEEAASDSALFNKTPLYVTKSDANGNYKIAYLPKQKFRAYAFTDKNKNRLYDGGDELTAFKNAIVEAGTDSVVNFKLFSEEPAKRFIKRSFSLYYGLAYVVYNKDVFSKVEALKSEQSSLVHSVPGKNDTCVVFFNSIYDTLQLKVTHGGSNDADTVKIPVASKEVWEKQKGKMNLDVAVEPIENGKLPYFSKPYLIFTTQTDSTKTDLSKLKIVSPTDTFIDPRVLLTSSGLNKWFLNNKLAQSTDYRVLLNKGAFTDKNGIRNDSVWLGFKTSAPEDYGNLNLKLFFPKKETYIVQLVNITGKTIAEQYTQLSLTSSSEQTFQFKNVWPGQYFVKVIEDVNGDKAWNTGNMMMKKQPETIYFNAQPVKIMPDWDAETEWKINTKE